jgi:hypothetical protein
MPLQPRRSSSRACLEDRVGDGGRCDSGDDGNAAFRRLEHDFDHAAALSPAEIGELPGRAERGEPVDASLDEVVAESRQDRRIHVARGMQRRNDIGKNAVEACLGHPRHLSGAGARQS